MATSGHAIGASSRVRDSPQLLPGGPSSSGVPRSMCMVCGVRKSSCAYISGEKRACIMSETKITLLFLGIVAVVSLLLIGAFVLAAYLFDIFIGLGALLVLTLTGVAWRKWQHSRIPVNEDRREQRRVLLEEEERRERPRREREQQAYDMQLASERHRQEMEMRWQVFELQRHLALTRAPYDDNGNPPIFV